MATFAIALPFSGRFVPPEWAVGLANLSFPTNCSYLYLQVKSGNRAGNRTALVKSAQEMGAKYLFFIDDDTMPPHDAVKKLYMALETADDDIAACGGIYTNKQLPSEPLVYMEENSGPHWKWKVGDIFPCWGVATGCMMIRMSVFKNLPEPWFRDIASLEEIGDDPLITIPDCAKGFYLTDDIYFCMRLAKAGYRMLAHGGVLPVHWNQEGKPFTLPLNSYPFQGMTFTPWYEAFGIQSDNLV